MEDAIFSQQLALVALPLLVSLQTGALVTWGLQGIVWVQVYNYYLSFPRDPLYMKVLVYGSLVIEMIQTILVTRDTYYIYTIGYGDFSVLNDLHYLWLTLPIFGGFVGFLCHVTFAYRIVILSESKVMGVIIMATAIVACTTAFIFGAHLHNAGVLSSLVNVTNIYLVCGLWNGASALCDVIIAACMIYYLNRSATGHKKTDYLISKIIRQTIETGILTATTSIVCVILFVGFRQKLVVSVYFIIPALMLTKLYAITILATFNNRPDAVGGAAIPSDLEHSYEDRKSRNIDQLSSEIRIGRTVVKQVWEDDVPMTQLSIYDEDSSSQMTKEEGDNKNTKRTSLTS